MRCFEAKQGHKDRETVLRGLEVILYIRRLLRLFSEALHPILHCAPQHNSSIFFSFLNDTLSTKPFPLHPFHYTLSTTPFPLHPFHYTLSATPFPLHPYHFILSTTPFPLHPFHYTLSTTPFPLHPFHYTLSTTPFPLHPFHYTLSTTPFPLQPFHYKFRLFSKMLFVQKTMSISRLYHI